MDRSKKLLPLPNFGPPPHPSLALLKEKESQNIREMQFSSSGKVAGDDAANNKNAV